MITPGHLSRRADLYHQLGQVTSSGLGLIAALELQYQHPPHRSMQGPLKLILQQLETGQTLDEALSTVPHWMPSFDRALIGAGEASGRLPEIFSMLADYYRDKARLARQFIAFTIYPVIVFHMAVLIFPVKRLTDLVLEAEFLGFILQKALVLGPLYALVAVLLWLFQSTRTHSVRVGLEKVTGLIPVLGGAMHAMSLSRLAAALEATISAGVPVFKSWKLASEASGSHSLSSEVRSFLPHWEAGQTPAESLRNSRSFPEVFTNQYASGEVSGKLDGNLRWLHTYYQDEGSRKMRTAVLGAAGILFAIVMLLVVWQVISFWIGYFQQIEQAIPD